MKKKSKERISLQMTVKHSFRFHPISFIEAVDGIEVSYKHTRLFKLFKTLVFVQRVYCSLSKLNSILIEKQSIICTH